MNKYLSRKKGFTLVETMIAVTVMSMVMGVVSAIYFSSLQVWRRCSSQAQADPPAHLAISRLAKELKNAYVVDEHQEHSITFTLPLTGEDGINVLPLQAGKRISYYVSDTTGVVGNTGTILWRKETNMVNGQQKLQRIADNIEDVRFEYVTSSSRVLEVYSLSITVLGQEGRQQYHSSFSSYTAMRN
jgi:prepilin-type N-terminal cleavage/methylation domain-containing protein